MSKIEISPFIAHVTTLVELKKVHMSSSGDFNTSVTLARLKSDKPVVLGVTRKHGLYYVIPIGLWSAGPEPGYTVEWEKLHRRPTWPLIFKITEGDVVLAVAVRIKNDAASGKNTANLTSDKGKMETFVSSFLESLREGDELVLALAQLKAAEEVSSRELAEPLKEVQRALQARLQVLLVKKPGIALERGEVSGSKKKASRVRK